MSETKPTRQRGSSTQFDTSRQTLIKVIVGILGVILLLLFILLGIISWAPRLALVITSPISRHNSDAIPRNMDIWAVYPDDTVRFISLVYPERTPEGAVTEAAVAGPLLQRGDDTISSTVFGGDLISVELLPGPGNDSRFLYELYTLSYQWKSDTPYGVDATVITPPYLSGLEDSGKRIALGAGSQTRYEQVIVAVALPPGAKVLGLEPEPDTYQDTPTLRPYRRAVVEGWTVFYYDTSLLDRTYTLVVDYTTPSAAESVPDFDMFAVVNAR